MTIFPRSSRFLLASSIPAWILVIGIIATTAAAYYSHRSAHANDQIRFDNAVQHIRSSIAGRVDTYIALLRAGAGLFAAEPTVDREQFGQFVARLDLRERYPGIQGIGFAIRIPAAQLDAFVAALRAGGRDFRVWPETARQLYFPILYLEPQDRRNRVAIGYDMFTEPVRRSAMLAAARTGMAAASGKVTLVQEIDPQKQPGFLIYAPVYDARPEMAADGRELRGFIYSPFRAGDFLSSVLTSGGDQPIVSVAVYDGDGTPDPAHLLFDSHPARPARARFAAEAKVEVAGRPWVVVVRTLPEFEQRAEARWVPWILGLGFLVTIGLAWASREEVKARAAAESAAEQLKRSEEALRDSEARLLQLVEAERHAHAEAAAANRAKDDFLATLSHELRTPLNAILGWATMLRSGRLGPNQQARALDVIARSARTQADLIEDLLDVSRITTGKLAIEMRQTRLAGPVRAALDAVRPAAEAKGIRLERRFEADPPVLGDPDRLQQVAWNLLSNAIKFTPAGGSVTVSVGRKDGQGELRVSDNGMGIAPSFLPHVFERFQQHDSSTTRVHGGMGLGLAIVKHLVEAHGGSVEAGSEGEGRGATFIVRLPVHDENPVTASRGSGPTLAARPMDRELEGVRALVVDDDPDALEMIGQVLAAHGARVEVAASASDALGVLNRRGVDVLLSDIGMPGTDGYGLVRELRKHPSAALRSLPAIAVTAYAGERDHEAALAAGFQAHLPKPIDIDTLRTTVRRLAAPLLGQRRPD